MPSAARECPDCGHEFVVERRELQTVDGELVEVNRTRRAKTFRDGDIVKNKISGQVFNVRGNALVYDGKLAYDCVSIESTFQAVYSEEVLELVSRPDPRREQATAATLDELIAIGRRRGMKSPAGWARHVMAARSLRSGKARVREVVA
jgi:hypothetical protein